MNNKSKKEKIKEILKELEGMVLELHRSAGQLDQVVRDINVGLSENDNVEYCNAIYRAMGKYRLDYKNCIGNLNEKEDEIWQRIYEIY